MNLTLKDTFFSAAGHRRQALRRVQVVRAEGDRRRRDDPQQGRAWKGFQEGRQPHHRGHGRAFHRPSELLFQT